MRATFATQLDDHDNGADDPLHGDLPVGSLVHGPQKCQPRLGWLWDGPEAALLAEEGRGVSSRRGSTRFEASRRGKARESAPALLSTRRTNERTSEDRSCRLGHAWPSSGGCRGGPRAPLAESEAGGRGSGPKRRCRRGALPTSPQARRMEVGGLPSMRTTARTTRGAAIASDPVFGAPRFGVGESATAW